MITKLDPMNKWLLVCLFLGIGHLGKAQGTDLRIEGPSELCLGTCGSFSIPGLDPINGNPSGCTVSWSASNGASQTGLSFSFCPTLAGAYVIQALVSCNDIQYQLQTTVLVNDFYQFEILTDGGCPRDTTSPGGQDCPQVCAGESVTYLATLPDSIRKNGLSWTVSGGSQVASTENSITVLWPEPGFGSITATFSPSDDSLCFTSAFTCAEVLPLPAAAIVAIPAVVDDTLRLCAGQPVELQSQSINATERFWNLGNGQTSNSPAVQTAYDTPGLYSLQLVTFNSCGCPDTTRLPVLVNDAFTPQLDCRGTVCTGDTVTYSATGGCGSYAWMVSGGNLLAGGGPADDFITVEWTGSTAGQIELLAANCPGLEACPTPSRFEIPILSPAIQIEGPERVCLGAVSTYAIPGYQGTAVEWEVSATGQIIAGQGSAQLTVQWPAFIPNAEQWVAVRVDNCYLECGGQGALPVQMLPRFRLDGPLEVCRGENRNYRALASDGIDYAYNWQLLDSSGTAAWSADGGSDQNISFGLPVGRYLLEAVPADPHLLCTPRAQLPVWVRSAPELDSIQGEERICPGQPYTYSAFSPAPGSQLEWTVQDGGTTYTRSGRSVNLSWISGGPYRLEAVQRTAAGCASPPVSLDVEAWDQLTIAGPDTVCREEIAIYEATPFPGQAYSWTVSPAAAADVLSATGSFQAEVLWTEAGPATIEVAACGRTATRPVHVDQRPEPAVLHPNRLCPGETASVSTATAYHTYAWYDENGALLSDLAVPDLGPGTYRVEVENSGGCTGQASFTIGQYLPPSVRLSTPDLQSVCNGTFVNLVANEVESGYTYQWFRNGSPLGPDASQFTTNQVGTYQVEVTDVNGCTALSNAINLQNCAPIDGDVPSPPGCPPPSAASFTWSANGDCNDIQFTNTTANGIPGSWFWSFNDPDSGPANTSAAENPTHIFTAAGYYRVFMQGDVETPAGDTVTCATLESIAVPLAADFDFADACPDAVVPFQDASSFLPAETPTGWSWTFGDPASGANNTSTLQNPDHLFSGPGTYAVTLVVTSSSGCTARRSKTITIFDRPAADFPAPADACEGTALPFDAMLGPDVLAVEWDFGDPASGTANTSRQANTQHLYTTAGTYAVSLEAKDIRGCRNTVTRAATIRPNDLTGTISQAPAPPLCEGDSLLLQAPPGGTAWQWSDGSTTEFIRIKETGTYAVTITDDAGCSYAPPAVTVDKEPAPALRIRAVAYDEAGRLTGFTYDSLAICAGQAFRLEAEGPGGSTYAWSNGENGNALAFTPAKGNLLPAGTYTFSVRATAQASGCTATDSFRLTVHPSPGDLQIQASAPEPRCPGTEYTFSLSNPEPSLDYRWNNGQTGPSMTTSQGGQYFLTATNAFGCAAESAALAIANSPDTRSIPAGCLRRCGPDSLCVPEVPGVERYQWLQDGLPTGPESEEVPDLIAFESGTYSLEMTDTLGCVFRSDPLTLELYQGAGRIQGGVYVDVNNNGILDGPDTLYSGAAILLQQGTSAPDSALSQGTGYAFADPVADLYQLRLDTTSLPSWLQPYYTQVDSNLLFCGDTIVVDWLLRFECPDLQTTDSLFFCQGQSANYQGIAMSSDTSFTWTTTTSYGCDSSVQVVARSIPPVQSQLQLEACSGSSVSYEGENLLPGETRTFTLPAANGCDSSVQVEVLEIFPSDTSLNLWACPGETVNYAGTALSAGQLQTFTLTAANGCDSLVEVSVSGLPVSSSDLELRTCPGEPAIYRGEELQAGERRTFVLTSSLGCDSLVQVKVTAYSELLLTAEATQSCADQPTGIITARADSGAPGPFTFRLDGGPPQAGNVFDGLAPGAYMLTVLDGNGCQSETEVQVPARPPLQVFAPDYAFPCDAGQLLLQPQVTSGEGPDLQFQWMDGTAAPERMIYAPGTFSLTVNNTCESRQLDIPVPLDYSTYEDGIYVPNAFSPNGDGRNDLFRAFTGPEVVVQEFELLVFDRWGNLMIRIRDPQDGWDGTHQGRLMNSAVFVWWLRAQIIACGQEVDVRRRGDVLLVR